MYETAEIESAVSTAAKVQSPGLRNPKVSASQLKAIRKFFTHPKDSYTVDELRRIYGRFLTDIKETMDLTDGEIPNRADAAGYLKSYVSPVVVGKALAGFVTPLSLKAVTVELPAWMVDGLSDCARQTGETVSDVIAFEILLGVEGIGFTKVFNDAMEERLPDYATVGATVTEAAVVTKRRKQPSAEEVEALIADYSSLVRDTFKGNEGLIAVYQNEFREWAAALTTSKGKS